MLEMNNRLMEKEKPLSAVQGLLESWRLAEAYEKDDLDQWASDLKLSIQEDLLKLSAADRELFQKEVNSAK